MNEKELIEKRNDLQEKMEGILDLAKKEKRAMNENEVKEENEEEEAPRLAQHGFDDGADGFTLMPDGEVQRNHVVRGTDEDAAEHNPGDDGAPSEIGRHDGPYNRAGAGDGGEVVSEEHRRVCRHVVDVVAHRVCRGRAGGVDAEKKAALTAFFSLTTASETPILVTA